MHAQSHHKKKHIQFSKHDKFDAILLEISLVTDNIFLLFLNHYIPPNNIQFTSFANLNALQSDVSIWFSNLVLSHFFYLQYIEVKSNTCISVIVVIDIN